MTDMQKPRQQRRREALRVRKQVAKDDAIAQHRAALKDLGGKPRLPRQSTAAREAKRQKAAAEAKARWAKRNSRPGRANPERVAATGLRSWKP